jgi:hypothetical protein
MEHLITGLCALSVVVIGLLIMTRAVAIEDVGSAILRGFVLIIVLMIVMCLFKGALAAILSATIAGLKTLLSLIFVIGLILVAVMIVLRRFVGTPVKHSTERSNDRGGEL